VPLRGLPGRGSSGKARLGAKLWPVAAPAISGPGWEPEPSGASQQVEPVSLPACGHAATPGAQPSPWLSSRRWEGRAEPHRGAGLGLVVVPVQLVSSLPRTDPVVRLLEGAVPGPAPQGVLPGGHGGPADPAAGGQGPYADPAQQLPGQRRGPPPRWGPRHRSLALLLLPGGTDVHWGAPLGFASPSRGRWAGLRPFPTA